MPCIVPSLPDVQWPASEGTIGVVGVAPWATVDFLSQTFMLATAQKDWHFPRVMVDANSKIPSRGRHFDLGETDPSPFIADTIDELIEAGATVVVVPCNTAHILFDQWSARAGEKVISIIDATLSEVPTGQGGTAAVLGSTHLARHRIYIDPLEAAGVECHHIDETAQSLIGRIIGEIKVANALEAATAQSFANLLRSFEACGINTIIFGCTELAQALRCLDRHSFHGAIIDSNWALAKAAIHRISGRAVS